MMPAKFFSNSHSVLTLAGSFREHRTRT